MSGPDPCCARLETLAAQGQGSHKENEDGINAALPTLAILIAVAPMSGDFGARDYKGQTALAHSVYLRREETRAMLQQLFTMKKKNIQVDGVYYRCSYTKSAIGILGW